MSIFAILPSISAIFVATLGIFVLRKNRKSKINQIFFLFTVSVFVWLFGTFMMFISKTVEAAIFWDRFVYKGVAFIPVIGYHLVLTLSRKESKKKLLFLGYFLSFLFLILSSSSHFVAGVYEYSWGIHTQARFLHHIFLVFFTFYCFLFFWQCYQNYRYATGIDRTRAKYILFDFAILTIGALAFLPAYKINIPPFVYLSGVLYTIILAYVIIKYRLMDIRMVMGKGAVYVFSFLSVIGASFLLIFLNQKLAQPISFNIFFPLIIIFAVLLFKILFWFFEKIGSKYFYYTFYSYQTVLTDLGRRLTQVLELKKLSSLIASTLIRTMKLDRTVILLRNPKTGDYKIQKNIGFREENGISLVKDNFLTRYLGKTQEPLVGEEISLAIRDAKDEKEKRNLEKLRENMKKIEAALCLPFFREQKIIGMIILGNKISGDPYSQQDLDLLTTLSSQASIALQNARLYSQVEDLSENLQEKVAEQTKELKDAYEKLKKLDEAKSEFISMASHQLRTPLTVIKGYLSMILEGDYGKLSQKMGKSLKNVFVSNERLIKIVNDLLNISRVELGKMELEKTRIQIENLIQSCSEEMKTEAEKKNLNLIYKKPKTKLPKLNIDELKIRQVITNLIDNAIRYTKKGKIEISPVKKKNSILIKINDTGEGLTKEEQQHIFEGFTRGSAGIDFFIEGAGLGLYVAKKYLDLHQGKMWAESSGKGKGSTFYVEIPVD